ALADHASGSSQPRQKLEQIRYLLGCVRGAALLAVAERGVGDPDVRGRIERHGIRVEACERWQDVRKRLTEVHRSRRLNRIVDWRKQPALGHGSRIEDLTCLCQC